ncbi:hypothetical protein BT67DRAFT_431077 [Trichocladium antarcticum]|uniref:Uncharacterized protein n=1 Tax=Trichocladium antarcticum TaxID=1450529 RepID=A0AAN6ZIA2_9PEZI|nr:hypothetical protein BT67DRAFT_431077 [Trichocladium antarcticum]
MGMGILNAAAGLRGYVESQLDRVVSPERRRMAYSQAQDLAASRPLLAGFIAIQAIFAIIPILLFLLFTVSTLLFVIGVALLFILFWVGVALLVLLLALSVTFGLALCAWLWASAVFVAGRSVVGTAQLDSPSPSDRPRGRRQIQARVLSPETLGSTSSTPPSLAEVEGQHSNAKTTKDEAKNGNKSDDDATESGIHFQFA